MRLALLLALALAGALAPALASPGLLAVQVPLPFNVPSALAALPDGSMLVGSLTDGKVWRLSPRAS